VGCDTFTENGSPSGELTLEDGRASYTVDELEANDGTTDNGTIAEGSNSEEGDYDETASVAEDAASTLDLEAVGSLSESGSDSVASYSVSLDYADDGGSD
jgi:hypothetical protein